MVRLASIRACLLVATLAALALGSAPARAEFVTSIVGAEAFGFNFVIGGPSGPVGASVSTADLDDIVNFINGVPGPYGPQPSGSVLNGSGGPPLTVTGFTTQANGTLYTFTPNAGARLGFFPVYGGGVATFSHTSLTGFVPDANTSLMEFSGEIQLTRSTNTLFDFSAFASGGQFQMDFTARDFRGNPLDFNTLLSTPQGTRINAGRSTWTMTAAPAPPSLPLLGIGLLCLAGYAWRRRQLALAPVK